MQADQNKNDQNYVTAREKVLSSGTDLNIKKILLAGEGALGKTTLLHRYINGQFNAETPMTTVPKLYLKEVSFENNDYYVIFWDFRLKFLYDFFCYDLDAAILLIDLTRPITLDNLEQWVNIVRKIDPDLPVLFLGTKLDLVDDIMVDDDYVVQFQEAYNLPDYIKVSSKSGENVKEAFNKIIEKSLENPRKKTGRLEQLKKEFAIVDYLENINVKDKEWFVNELNNCNISEREKEELAHSIEYLSKLPEFKKEVIKDLMSLTGLIPFSELNKKDIISVMGSFANLLDYRLNVKFFVEAKK